MPRNNFFCDIVHVKENGQAYKAGVEMGDIICHPPKNKFSTLEDGSVQLDVKENLREADYSEVYEWAVSLKRPIIFLVKRIQENIASLADDNIQGDHLKNLL